MRAFFGLSPDVKTKVAIQAWHSKAFPHLDDAVPTANFHVTLAFLGYVFVKQLDTIHRLMNEMLSITAFKNQESNR
jgi:2'-5' RNA ligase